MRRSRAIDKAENIVKDEVASGTIGEELEGLAVVHGCWRVVNLQSVSGDICTISYPGLMGNKQDNDIPYQESASDHNHNSTILV